MPPPAHMGAKPLSATPAPSGALRESGKGDSLEQAKATSVNKTRLQVSRPVRQSCNPVTSHLRQKGADNAQRFSDGY